MKRLLLVVGAWGLTVAAAVIVLNPATSGGAPKPAPTTEQADSTAFTLNFPNPDVEGVVGDVLYCGVGQNSEPFQFDLAVSNPPLFDESENLVKPGYEHVGWLSVMLQGTQSFGGPFTDNTRRPEFNVPSNGSYAFGLTLGSRPNEDQIVQVHSLPLGDPDGGGEPMYGYASVRANKDAVDPFTGDLRTDNYCVTIGLDGGGFTNAGTAEFLEGQISTTLPVPDDWVVDNDGSDGGFLRGFPH